MVRLALKKGTKVRHAGEDAVIVAMQGFDDATVKVASGQCYVVPVADLLAVEAGSKPSTAIDPIRQGKVPKYLGALRHLFDRRNSREEIEAAGKILDISIAATYKALARYNLTKRADDLPPPTKPGGRGKSRLDPRIEAIIEAEADRRLLKRGNYDPAAFKADVKAKVEKLGLTVSESTLNNRVKNITPWTWTSKRSGHDEAEKTLAPHVSGHPGAAAPLAQVQGDHWFVDMDLLSDDRLAIIGRAWATIAIDVFSRCVWGMHVGLASPSETTVGLMMINGFLRKEPMLKALGIESPMPIYGKPRQLLLDNAGEFTGESMQASSDTFVIDLTWRPVGKPQYGSHIERLNGTLADKFRRLPGATGSSAKDRKAFRPEATAAMTLDDLRKHMWMLVDEYHHTMHTGVGKTPLQAWSDHYFGSKGAVRPPPAVYADDDDLRIPWYPLEKRSLQQYGIEIDYLFYYNETIEHLVKNRSSYPRVSVRRHPLDVRLIYLLHPETGKWCEVPCRQLGFPAASLVDIRRAKAEARKEKRKPTPEVLRDILERNAAHVEEVKKKTRTAARDQARRADEERQRKIEREAKSKGAKAAKAESRAAGPPPPGPTGSSAPPDFGSPQGLEALLAHITEDEVEAMFDE